MTISQSGTAVEHGQSIGMITSHMSFAEHGGANYSRHIFAEALERRGYNVTIYTLNFMDENHVPVEHSYSIEESRIDSYTMFDGVATFFSHISGWFADNDLIHVYVPGIAPLVGLYKRVRGDETPTVATLNGYTPFCTNTALMDNECWQDCTLSDKIKHARMEPAGSFTPGSTARFAFNDLVGTRAMNELDKYLCLSPSVAQIYEDVGIEKERLEVVPNMVDQEFCTKTQTDGGLRDETTILYVGRVDAPKGIDVLLEGISKLESDDYHLELVGANILNYGRSLDEWKKYADELGIREKTTFHGWVDYADLSEYFARGEIFVHPGNWPEPFGRTIIEAMQHELPVVCSNVGAPPWIKGSAGMTFENKNPGDLADTLDTVLADDELRTLLADNTTVELERFNEQNVMDQFERVYQEVQA